MCVQKIILLKGPPSHFSLPSPPPRTKQNHVARCVTVISCIATVIIIIIVIISSHSTTQEIASFDYQNEAEMATALEYRKAELPFKVYNVNKMRETARKWTDKYLIEKMDGTVNGGKKMRGARPHFLVETSTLKNNYFIWYDPRRLKNKAIMERFHFNEPEQQVSRVNRRMLGGRTHSFTLHYSQI